MRKGIGVRELGLISLMGFFAYLAFTNLPSKFSFATAVPTFTTQEEARLYFINFSSFHDSETAKKNRDKVWVAAFPGEGMPETIRIIPDFSDEIKASQEKLKGDIRRMIIDIHEKMPTLSPEELEPRLRPLILTPFVIDKMEILADALLEQNIKNLNAKRPDIFTSELLAAAGYELTAWFEDTKDDKEFRGLFHGKGPWRLVFLAMSPSSMHEYMEEMEPIGEGIDEHSYAKRLPVDLLVQPKGDTLEVEMRAAGDLSLVFTIDEKNRVAVLK